MNLFVRCLSQNIWMPCTHLSVIKIIPKGNLYLHFLMSLHESNWVENLTLDLVMARITASCDPLWVLYVLYTSPFVASQVMMESTRSSPMRSNPRIWCISSIAIGYALSNHKNPPCNILNNWKQALMLGLRPKCGTSNIVIMPYL